MAAPTFTIKPGPLTTAVLRCIQSRTNPAEFHVLYASAYYISRDFGATFTLMRAAVSGQTFNDMCLGAFTNVIASTVTAGGAVLERAEDGEPFDFSGVAVAPTDIVAVAPHIRQDRFYCYGSNGLTYYSTSGRAMTQGASLPSTTAGNVKVRGLASDGWIVNLLYVANGAQGAYKHTGGFDASRGDYYRIREPGVGSSDASAHYYMVRPDGRFRLRAASATIVTDTTWKRLSLWNGTSNNDPPDGWNLPAFDDSLWSAAVVATATTGDTALIPTGASRIWASTTPANAAEQVLFRKTFTLSAGVVTTATLELSADDAFLGVWINGQFVGAEYDAGAGPKMTYTIDPALFVAGGTNVIAVWGKEIG